MRSRFAAFAKRDVDYLFGTLHSEHTDRSRPREDVSRELRDGAASQRYMGLTIVEHATPDEHGIARVLFVARVFERGRDRSFVELSTFAYENGGWRYLAGEGDALAQLRVPLATLTIANFATAIRAVPHDA